ncbi:hypothetical protein BTE28158_05799 [Burkholderia territorii]|nr:hypothetical protein BTE28158_05799 [Burkholderia territorii]
MTHDAPLAAIIHFLQIYFEAGRILWKNPLRVHNIT